jgi:hypothetical protein
VGTKGVFERAVACELTLAGSGLWSVIAKKFRHFGELQLDPLQIGQPFIYEAKILQVDWKANRVRCVLEDPKYPGQRLVDLGFLVNSRRVLCELKDVGDQNKLWKQCYTFFSKIQNHSSFQDTDLVVFMSLQQFTDHTPNEKKVKKAVSAHTSRTRALEFIRAPNSRFAIVEAGDWKGKTVLPISTLAASDNITPLDVTNGLAAGVQGMSPPRLISEIPSCPSSYRQHLVY